MDANTRDPRKTTPKRVLIKMAKIKDKDRLLKATRESKQITHKGKPIRLSSAFPAETLRARTEWHDIFNKRIDLPQTVSTVYSGGTPIDGSVPKVK